MALAAFGIARDADLSPVMDHLVGEADPVVAGKDSHQVLLDLFRRLRFGEVQAMGNAEDVRVDHYPFSLTKAHAEDHIGGFARRTGNGDEFGQRLGNLAAKLLRNFLGCALNGFGLVTEEAGGLDQLLELCGRGFGHVDRSREAAEQLRRNHVHADIGALRGKDRRDQQFPWRAVVQRADGIGVGLVKSLEDRGDTLGRERVAEGARLSCRHGSQRLLRSARGCKLNGSLLRSFCCFRWSSHEIGVLQNHVTRSGWASTQQAERLSYTGRMISRYAIDATILLLGISVSTIVRAQQATPEPKLRAFEVAAIKLSKPDDPHHGWHGTNDRIFIENYSLRRLIRSAYGLKSDLQVIGGPDWSGKQAFDIEAKIDEADVDKMHNMSPEERQKARNEMLQSLLAERFQLKARVDQRVMLVYALVVAKSGPKLAPAAPSAPGKGHGISVDNGHMVATDISMSSLADDLAYAPETGDRVVLNHTGLTGEYDFKLNWTEDPGTGVPPDSEFPGLFTALEEQLGLKLESQKGSVPVVIVESAAKPVVD